MVSPPRLPLERLGLLQQPGLGLGKAGSLACLHCPTHLLSMEGTGSRPQQRCQHLALDFVFHFPNPTALGQRASKAGPASDRSTPLRASGCLGDPGHSLGLLLLAHWEIERPASQGCWEKQRQ